MATLAHSPYNSTNDATAQRTPGQTFTDEATGYRFIYAKVDSSAATLVAGQPFQIKSGGVTATTFTVTNKANGGLATAVGVGICMNVATAGYFTFFMTRGYASVAKESGVNAITIGAPLYIDANDDSCLDSAASGNIFGWTVAASDDTANTVPMWVNTGF